ncbi:MAG: MBL fold metallo-hydrolase [Clostridia bacterium]|nr:MBL fold metallo-hydrolase [Clostridia bacterium]
MRRLVALALCVLLCAPLLLCAGCAAGSDENAGTRLIALNIGKADCLLLLYQDKAYLIDSGWERTWGALREMLRQYGVTHLDGVFLTHCHKDHYGGFAQLAQSEVEIGAWYAAAVYYDLPAEGHPLVAAAALRGEEVTFLSAGDTLSLGEGATLTVLGPISLNTENENNNSLVFSVETPDGTLLFTGDMKLEEETELLLANAIPAAQVLKVPFHGDNTASSEYFAQAVMPQIALICTATWEEADTPASSVVKRYGRVGAQVIVTQEAARAVEIILRSGQAKAENVVWDLPDYSASVSSSITADEDLLTLTNASGEAISLAGWVV